MTTPLSPANKHAISPAHKVAYFRPCRGASEGPATQCTAAQAFMLVDGGQVVESKGYQELCMPLHHSFNVPWDTPTMATPQDANYATQGSAHQTFIRHTNDP